MDAEELSFQFSKGAGLQLVSELCDLCGNREVGSVRRICFDGRTVVLAGRREDVGVNDVATRRALYEHDTGSVDRRRPAAVWLVEPGPPGGVIATAVEDGFLCERGPSGFLDGPAVPVITERSP